MEVVPSQSPAHIPQSQQLDTLQAASIFHQTPREVLAEVVDLFEEIDVKIDEPVFEKGDPGDAMYIIIQGAVRVHDGEMTLNYLGDGDSFGEMAVIDAAPRSASITAVKETTMLRLDQAGFEKMVNRIPGSAWGIIRVLTGHLRGRVRDMREEFDYMQQFNKVTAAAVALEAGIYESESLDAVSARTDELGQLSRVFQRMVREVYAREQRLKAQIQALTIQIDETKKAKEVAEITETDYFQELAARAEELRGMR